MTNPQLRAQRELHGLIHKSQDSDDSDDREEDVSLFRNNDSELETSGLLPEAQLHPGQSGAEGPEAEVPVSRHRVLDLDCRLESIHLQEPAAFRPQADTPIPTSNQSVERNDESQPLDGYHIEEMSPREIEFEELRELRTETAPSISDNLMFAVEAGGAKARVRKLDDPSFVLEVPYPEGDKVLEVLRVAMSERLSAELDARLLFSVYRVREKSQERLYLRIHLLKACHAVVLLYGGSFALSSDPHNFPLKQLRLVCNRRACCWTTGRANFLVLTFREDKLRLVAEADKKETCFSQKCLSLEPGLEVLDVDLLASKKPCLLVSTGREVLLAEENETRCVFRCSPGDSVVAARFVPGEQAAGGWPRVLVVELQCCRLFELCAGEEELRLLQVLQMPRGLPDKALWLTGEEVLVSSRFVVVQRRSDFRAWILLLAGAEEGAPTVARQATIALKGSAKHHSFYCAALGPGAAAAKELVYFYARDSEWALVHLAGCGHPEAYSRVDQPGDSLESCPLQSEEPSALYLSTPLIDSDPPREDPEPESLETAQDRAEQLARTEDLGQLLEPQPSEGGTEPEPGLEDWQQPERESEPEPQTPMEPSEAPETGAKGLGLLDGLMGGPTRSEAGRSQLRDDGIIIPGAEQTTREPAEGADGDDMMNTIMSLSKHSSLQPADPLEAATPTRPADTPDPPAPALPREPQPDTRPPEPRAFKVKYHHEHQPEPVEPLHEYGSASRTSLAAQDSYSAPDRAFPGSLPQTPSDLATSKRQLDTRAVNPKPTTKKPEKIDPPPRKQDKPRKHEQANGARGYANQDRSSRGKFVDDKQDEFVPKKTQAKTVEIKKDEPSQSHHASYSPAPANPAGDFELKQKPPNRSSGGSPKNSQSSAPVLAFEQPQRPSEQRASLSLEEVNAAVKSVLGSFKEDIVQMVDARHRETLVAIKAVEASDTRREERIEEIVRRVVSKCVEEKMINDLKSEFNCLMSNNYNEVFEDVIVPCFENYLGKVCDKTNSVLEKGIKFYNERIMVEERKVNVIKDQFALLTAQATNNAKALNKTAQDVSAVVKDIASSQNKEIIKRISVIEENIDKMAEKQDRTFELMEKIGSKLKVNEEDKKIDIPNSAPPAYAAQPQNNTHLLQEVLEQLRNPPPMQMSQQHQPHHHYPAYQRPPISHTPHGYPNHGPPPSGYSSMQPAHADLMTQSLLLDTLGASGHQQLQYQTPQHLVPQLGHHLGSNGNSVGSSTPNTGLRSSMPQPLQQSYSVSSLQPQQIVSSLPQGQNLSGEELSRLLQLIQIQKDQRQSFGRADGAVPE